MNEEKKEGCCSSSGCCHGKKLLVSILIGLLLLAVGYSLGKGNFCPLKNNPASQVQK